MRIANQATNTLYNKFTLFIKLQTTNEQCNKFQINRIYMLTCRSGNSSYISQISWQVKIRFAEHQGHIKNNNPKSAYVLHILNKRHECGTIQNTMELLITCKKVRELRPNSTIHGDTGHGLLHRKRSTQNRLITTDGPVSYWLRYKTHHIHMVRPLLL
jgi:hypothetical protein